jgi:phosphoribosylaminoimidazolecarboxamide formyltransferase/IMP cyclohydrolase
MAQALLSVSDKAGLADFAAGLSRAGFALLSTGGTWRALRDAGLDVTQVSEVTGFPEILDGRVKTLHPAIHGGILARPSEEHLAEIAQQRIEPIDVVVVNLYPFREAAARAGSTLEEVVEEIDIGGPALLRAAAKNFERVWAVVDPSDYPRVLTALAAGDDRPLRHELARKAFAHTASYDSAIAAYLGRSQEPAAGGADPLPELLVLELERAEILRYGENPHLRGARYRERGNSGWWDAARQHKGAQLSYLNLFDAEAAWRLVFEFDQPGCVIVKHANPCGVALSSELLGAYQRAYEADPKSAFGGVVALNRPVDATVAEQIMGNAKADVLIAPDYDREALALLSAKRKAMRVLEAPAPGPREPELRRVSGGFLVQEPDTVRRERSEWRVVTRREPDEQQWHDLELAWTVCARTSSNAIVLARDGVAVGIAAGQQSRVDAAELAARKAAGRALDGACASDAFYPFRDGLDAAAQAGVAAVIQPGGSVRDDEVIAAADEHGMAMVFTGRRHFRH